MSRSRVVPVLIAIYAAAVVLSGVLIGVATAGPDSDGQVGIWLIALAFPSSLLVLGIPGAGAVTIGLLVVFGLLQALGMWLLVRRSRHRPA